MAALVINIAEFKAEYKRKKSMTSYQRALEAAEEREERRRRECWRFWAGYEHASVGACQSSTEAAALARIEVQARGRRRVPIPNMARGEERTAPVLSLRKRGGYAWGGIGMVDIIAAWRVACAEHDAGRGEKNLTSGQKHLNPIARANACGAQV